jgi:C4-dicarboxylate-specific signal transduction histidine kinase
LAFFGRIGAGITHDMRNVLAIIGQNAGLLDDQIALAESGKLLSRKRLDLEQLKTVSARIARQVERGIRTMERFSRFAHATDEQTASFDLTALMETMTALAERHVRLAGCKLESDIADQPIRVTSSPFRLQRAVFSAIELLAASLEKGESVTVGLAAEGPAAVISVSGNIAGGDEPVAHVSELATIMSELTGNVETSRDDGILSLTIKIPIE